MQDLLEDQEQEAEPALLDHLVMVEQEQQVQLMEHQQQELVAEKEEHQEVIQVVEVVELDIKMEQPTLVVVAEVVILLVLVDQAVQV